MKLLAKPISSPSRTDKFPPPLMRFLRSNAGSRSRGRSRSSPMFYMRSKKNAAAIETTQEPTSPKVTCIGQVRVRRSSKSKSKTAASRRGNGQSTAAKRRRCWWLRNTLCCPGFCKGFGKPRPFCGFYRKWGLFSCSGYCKKVDSREDSFRDDSNRRNEKSENYAHVGFTRSGSMHIRENENNGRYEHLGVQIGENKKDFDSMPSSPPKNALLLTRCRSAPYRSSSLAVRFWGSPVSSAETGENENDAEIRAKEKHEFDELQKPSSENAELKSTDGNESEESGISVKNVRDSKAIGGGAVHPLLLTRCKSEPARTGERLNPDSMFVRQNRLSPIKPCSQPNS